MNKKIKTIILYIPEGQLHHTVGKRRAKYALNKYIISSQPFLLSRPYLRAIAAKTQLHQGQLCRRLGRLRLDRVGMGAWSPSVEARGQARVSVGMLWQAIGYDIGRLGKPKWTI